MSTRDDRIKITLNGETLEAASGKTILEVAAEQNIEIPTLCHDPRLEPYGSCWLCLVHVEGARGFVPACSAMVRPGMVITTDSPAVLSARKTALDLLLSNHYGDCKAPCTLTCPSNIDVQGYVGLIANKRYGEALELIKKDNPFPSVCGRVCPRPCEDECRRHLVDQPVAIDWLKRYVADLDLFSENSYDPICAGANGKKVAVVGAGPGGLSAAYYLAQGGVSVTVFEAQEKAGGMLRYGIPDYRLPQDLLDLEIATVLRLGVKLKTGVRLGKDIRLNELRESYDAVVLALGAWKSRSLRVPGEDHPGVLSGIDFLHEIACGRKVKVGPRVAVIGGGNTAIDAARVSVRLGASEVYLFYRRTRKEMPASEAEIDEALEEGVKITFLAAPVRIDGDGKGLKSIRLNRMELGEPDVSGRRRPVPIKGSEFDREIDTVIAAIGQYSETLYLEGEGGLIDERSRLICDADTGATGSEGVFAAGDLVTGPDIAIRAIAGGKYAASSVMSYLENKKPRNQKEFLVKKDELEKVTEDDYKDEKKIPREIMPVAPAEERKRNFQEIELGYSEEQVLKEASRCLECGCQDIYECRLKRYGEEYRASAAGLIGEFQKHPVDESHPFIARDQSRCILCGRCVRICLEVQGIGALGYIERGFSSFIAPSFNKPLGEDDLCIGCGQCVSSCPVGALTEKNVSGKTVPLEERIEEGYCPLCSMACPVEYRRHGGLPTRVTGRLGPDGIGNLCEKGRFRNLFFYQADYRPLHAARMPGLDNREISLEEARTHLEGLLNQSSKILMKLSPFLAGEAIDYFLEKAKGLDCSVKPGGLEGLNPAWLDLLPGPGETGFFEDHRADPKRRAAIVVGNLEDSNNVAFTEVYRLKKQGLFELWTVGSDSPVCRRVADRVFPNLSQLQEAFQYAQLERRMVDLLVNPEEIPRICEREIHNVLLKTIIEASFSKEYRLTLFWNSRNSAYLLRSLTEKGLLSRKMEDYDLLLAVGGEIEESREAKRVIRWGAEPKGSGPDVAGLFLPLHQSFLFRGYTEPSGRKPFRAGEVDLKLLATQSLL